MHKLIAGLGMLGASALAGRFAMSRIYYLPEEVQHKPPYVPEGTDLAIWKYEAKSSIGETRYYVTAFVGKQNRPLFNFYVLDEKHREQYIEKAAASRREDLAAKVQRRQAKREYTHDYKVGDILSASWGYDQTNVDFYEVTKVISPKEIEIRGIGQKVVKSEGPSDYVMPTPGRYTSSARRKRVTAGGVVKVSETGHAFRWSGEPKYQSGPYSGH